MLLATIIPSHNRCKSLDMLLSCLHHQEDSPDNLIVVVVDGSTDGTLEMISNKYPDVHIIQGDGNWWYTKSMNEGFKYARLLNPDYILTLNDDLYLESDYLKRIVINTEYLEKNSIIGSVGVELYSQKKIYTGIRKFNKFLYKSIPYRGNYKSIRNSAHLPGRGMIIPLHILLSLKYFDEGFPQYGSDTDFCLRAKKSNYNVIISDDLKVSYRLDTTSKSSYFLKPSFTKFISDVFFNQHASVNILVSARMIWRHGCRPLFLFTLFINFLTKMKNYFKYKYFVQ